MRTWLEAHETWLAWLGGISAATFLAGLLLVPWIVIRLPADHYLPDRGRAEPGRARHPALRLLLRAGRNLLGGVLVLAGVAMLVLPGQGILTILLGLGLLDVPGKHRLELLLVRRAPVLAAIQWIRTRAGRPPLRLPPLPLA